MQLEHTSLEILELEMLQDQKCFEPQHDTQQNIPYLTSHDKW